MKRPRLLGLALALVAALLSTSCTDDGPAADAAPDGAGPTSTTTTLPPDAVAERTQMIVTLDGAAGHDPNALAALATAIRSRFAAAKQPGTRTMVVGTRVVIDAPVEADNLDVNAMGATQGRLEFRPVLARQPICPAAQPPPAPDQPAVLRYRDHTDGCAQVGPRAPVAIADAEAVVSGDRWVVSVRLTADGAAALSQVFAACFAKDAACPAGAVALAIDGTIHSSAAANASTFDGPAVQISGDFDGVEAKRIAAVLSPPPLPDDVRVLEPPVIVRRRIVGPHTASGQGLAVIVRYATSDDVWGAIDDVSNTIASQMTRLGATAVFVSADSQLGELMTVIVGATDPTETAAAVVDAAGVDDPSRVVTVAAVVP